MYMLNDEALLKEQARKGNIKDGMVEAKTISKLINCLTLSMKYDYSFI